jgi:spore protease
MRTDLATELDLSKKEGIEEQIEKRGKIDVSTINIITEGASKRLGKPRGKYITLDIGKIWLSSDEDFDSAVDLIAEKLSMLAEELCGKKPDSILIVGLGNRRITADALGDEAVGLITVTRHIKSHSKELYEMLGGREISAIVPGVLGQTGIESVEIVRGVCENVNPEIIVAIDSLCARSTDRLATTVQLGTSGICPGSGIGNRRKSLDKETLGVPVIVLGIPTVVDSSTLVIDALEKAGIYEISDELEQVLENGKSFFVTPKETDTIVRELSRLTANALELAFSS